MTDNASEIDRIRMRLRVLTAEQSTLERRLAQLSSPHAGSHDADTTADSRGQVFTPADKIALFQHLFAGRGEWKRGICGNPQVKCGDCPNQAFIPLSAEIVEAYLRGHHSMRPPGTEFVAGVYPLLLDETCRLVAVDFDGVNWANDVRAYVQSCAAHGVHAALERSRSGNGAHVWIFFADAVPARDARTLAAWFVTVTMESRPEIGFESYDRIFPSQDTMPTGRFGNLVALPLQRRARDQGNTVFVDAGWSPGVQRQSMCSACRQR